jgi:hypothetical protein
MENEFSKPKVLIDLEEYEWLNDIEKSFNNLEILHEDLLSLIYQLRYYFGTGTLNVITNEIEFKISNSIDLLDNETKQYLETYITNQIIIEREIEKRNGELK